MYMCRISTAWTCSPGKGQYTIRGVDSSELQIPQMYPVYTYQHAIKEQLA